MKNGTRLVAFRVPSEYIFAQFLLHREHLDVKAKFSQYLVHSPLIIIHLVGWGRFFSKIYLDKPAGPCVDYPA
jgi:hypothetical protein